MNAYRINCEGRKRDEIVAIMCMQGLANRDSSKLYIDVSDSHWVLKLREKDKQKYNLESTTYMWADWFAKKKGYIFTNIDSLEQLACLLEKYYDGVVVYRKDSVAQELTAVIMAGLYNLIAVTDDILKISPKLASQKIYKDLSSSFESCREAAIWGMENLLPECSKTGMTSLSGDFTEIYCYDLAVQERQFIYLLNYFECRTDDEFELIEKITSHLEPSSPVYGWGTSESAAILGLAKSGSFLMCTHTANLSFQKMLKRDVTEFKHKKEIDKSRIKLNKDKYYLTFIISEGDTLKFYASMMQGGQWWQEERGRFPINWGANSWIVQHYPGMMEYYYDTLTPNDRFVSAVTGYGYYNVKYSSNTMQFADLENKWNKYSDITAGTVYSVHGMLSASNGIFDDDFEEWLDRRGCAGYTFESSQNHYLRFTKSGKPVLGLDWRLFYWQYRHGSDPIEGVVNTINELAENNKPPFFIPLYSGSPEEFSKIYDKLDKDKFEVVFLDEMIELAKQHGKEIKQTHIDEGRLKPEKSESVNINACHVDWDKVPDMSEWDNIDSSELILDLSKFNAGKMSASYKFAWNEDSLFMLIKEIEPPEHKCEASEQRNYEVDEFDMVDGTALYMDFDNNGTSERGDYTPWLGFSSKGRRDLYVNILNNRVLVSTEPEIQITTDIIEGRRIINAAVKWKDIEKYLENYNLPQKGLCNSIKPGYFFGCQPLLLEGMGGRAFLNGNTGKKQDNVAASLEKSGLKNTEEPPTGFDKYSINVKLI